MCSKSYLIQFLDERRPIVILKNSVSQPIFAAKNNSIIRNWSKIEKQIEKIKICTQTRLPKTAKICAACTANWQMLPKNELQKNIWINYKYKITIQVQEHNYSLKGKSEVKLTMRRACKSRLLFHIPQLLVVRNIY
jgi:hypothetical protein